MTTHSHGAAGWTTGPGRPNRDDPPWSTVLVQAHSVKPAGQTPCTVIQSQKVTGP